MIVVVAIVAAIVAVLVGVTAGWRWVVAPLFAYAILAWLLGSLRALVKDTRHLPDESQPVDALASGERTLFWCEECGTEVLLVTRGTTRAPSHCGQRMHQRTEMTESD